MSNAYGPPPSQFGPPGQPPGGPPGQPPGPPPGGPHHFGPGGPGGPGGPHFPYGGPPRPPRNNGGTAVALVCGALVLALLGTLGLAFATGWFDGGGKKGSTASDPSTLPMPTLPDRPLPDPTASAFQRVTAGDCFTLFDTGRGEGHSLSWSSDAPPPPVSCSSTDALVRVSKVTDNASGCARGHDKSYWSYQSRSDHTRTVLCLSRQFHAEYCLMGKQTGSGTSARMQLGAFTSADCKAKRLPAKYNQILHVTGVYRATASTTGQNCRRGQGDRTLYYAWKMNDEKTLLCAMVFRG